MASHVRGYNKKRYTPSFFVVRRSLFDTSSSTRRNISPRRLPRPMCARLPRRYPRSSAYLAPFVFLAMTAIGWFSLEENLQVEGAKIAPSVCFFAIGAVGTVATVATYFLLFMNTVHVTQGIVTGTSG